jgi:hypothetical protein
MTPVSLNVNRDPLDELIFPMFDRRTFLSRFGLGLGGIALNEMLANASSADRGVLGGTHFRRKAKRIIYLFMSGGPSHLDLFDYKPLLNQRHGEQLPDSVRGGQRLTGMSGNQSSIPMVGSPFKFTQHGQAGGWFSELLPHTASIADDICVARSMFTESINHGPGVTFFQTGSQIAGRPSFGSWLSYGLGAENANLPSFTVLITKGKGGQPLGSRSVGQRLFADEASGRAVPCGEGSGALSRQSGGCERGQSPADAGSPEGAA